MTTIGQHQPTHGFTRHDHAVHGRVVDHLLAEWSCVEVLGSGRRSAQSSCRARRKPYIRRVQRSGAKLLSQIVSKPLKSSARDVVAAMLAPLLATRLASQP